MASFWYFCHPCAEESADAVIQMSYKTRKQNLDRIEMPQSRGGATLCMQWTDQLSLFPHQEES